MFTFHKWTNNHTRSHYAKHKQKKIQKMTNKNGNTFEPTASWLQNILLTR